MSRGNRSSFVFHTSIGVPPARASHRRRCAASGRHAYADLRPLKPLTSVWEGFLALPTPTVSTRERAPSMARADVAIRLISEKSVRLRPRNWYATGKLHARGRAHQCERRASSSVEDVRPRVPFYRGSAYSAGRAASLSNGALMALSAVTIV